MCEIVIPIVSCSAQLFELRCGYTLVRGIGWYIAGSQDAEQRSRGRGRKKEQKGWPFVRKEQTERK